MEKNPRIDRVLIVEDEVMVAWMLEAMLTDLGYAIAGMATHIDQALSALVTETVHAVVLDISLNGEETYPVADALAARAIPFLFSTGYPREGLRKGYRDFPALQKPYAVKALADMLLSLPVPWGPTSPS